MLLENIKEITTTMMARRRKFYTIRYIPDNGWAGTDRRTDDCIIYSLLMHLVVHLPMVYSLILTDDDDDDDGDADDDVTVATVYPIANPVFLSGYAL